MDIYDIAGIGVGPFNLSLASLLDPLKNINSISWKRNLSSLGTQA